MSSGHLAMLRQHSYQYKAHMTNIRNLLQAHLQPLCSASLWILILPLILLCLKSRLELGVPGCLLLFVQIEHYTIIFNLQVQIQLIILLVEKKTTLMYKNRFIVCYEPVLYVFVVVQTQSYLTPTIHV